MPAMTACQPFLPTVRQEKFDQTVSFARGSALNDRLDALLHQVHDSTISFLTLGLALGLLLYATQGTPIPAAEWQIVDIVGEGGVAVLAGFWAALVARSRPGGRVTLLLTGGLSAIMLGSWLDCLDEFFQVAHGVWWDNILESGLSISGMLVLTLGLLDWRQEQFRISEHFERRERLFRDHRVLDRTTQLANADYLRRQLRMEHHRAPDQPCSLIMLDINHFHLVNRVHGIREGDRVLQSISQLLLLHSRQGDLLCRYAGDRFALLLPGTSETAAREIAQHLSFVVLHSRLHTRQGVRLLLSARVACAMADTDPDVLIAHLNASIESLQRAVPHAGQNPA